MTHTAATLREKTQKERATLLAEACEELRAARFATKGTQHRNSKRINTIRKDIARILTVDTEEATKE